MATVARQIRHLEALLDRIEPPLGLGAPTGSNASPLSSSAEEKDATGSPAVRFGRFALVAPELHAALCRTHTALRRVNRALSFPLAHGRTVLARLPVDRTGPVLLQFLSLLSHIHPLINCHRATIALLVEAIVRAPAGHAYLKLSPSAGKRVVGEGANSPKAQLRDWAAATLEVLVSRSVHGDTPPMESNETLSLLYAIGGSFSDYMAAFESVVSQEITNRLGRSGRFPAPESVYSALCAALDKKHNDDDKTPESGAPLNAIIDAIVSRACDGMRRAGVKRPRPYEESRDAPRGLQSRRLSDTGALSQAVLQSVLHDVSSGSKRPQNGGDKGMVTSTCVKRRLMEESFPYFNAALDRSLSDVRKNPFSVLGPAQDRFWEQLFNGGEGCGGVGDGSDYGSDYGSDSGHAVQPAGNDPVNLPTRSVTSLKMILCTRERLRTASSGSTFPTAAVLTRSLHRFARKVLHSAGCSPQLLIPHSARPLSAYVFGAVRPSASGFARVCDLVSSERLGAAALREIAAVLMADFDWVSYALFEAAVGAASTSASNFIELALPFLPRGNILSIYDTARQSSDASRTAAALVAIEPGMLDRETTTDRDIMPQQQDDPSGKAEQSLGGSWLSQMDRKREAREEKHRATIRSMRVRCQAKELGSALFSGPLWAHERSETPFWIARVLAHLIPALPTKAQPSVVNAMGAVLDGPETGPNPNPNPNPNTGQERIFFILETFVSWLRVCAPGQPRRSRGEVALRFRAAFVAAVEGAQGKTTDAWAAWDAVAGSSEDVLGSAVAKRVARA